jgi:hypothetical protein
MDSLHVEKNRAMTFSGVLLYRYRLINAVLSRPSFVNTSQELVNPKDRFLLIYCQYSYFGLQFPGFFFLPAISLDDIIIREREC